MGECWPSSDWPGVVSSIGCDISSAGRVTSFPAPECALLLDLISFKGWIDHHRMQDIALHVHRLALVGEVEAALVSAIGTETELAIGA